MIELAQAVAEQQPGRLTKIPGVGKKTAERLLLELRDKLDITVAGAGMVAVGGGDGADVLNALEALGYSEREAMHATKQLPEGLSVTEAIRQSLKLLSKA